MLHNETRRLDHNKSEDYEIVIPYIETAISLIKKYSSETNDRKRIRGLSCSSALADRMLKNINQTPEKQHNADLLKTLFKELYPSIKVAAMVNRERALSGSTLNAKNIRRFLEVVYYPFFRTLELHYLSDTQMHFPLESPAKYFIPNTIMAKFSITQMQKSLQQHRIIPLRALPENATTLIFGCGHDWLGWPHLGFEDEESIVEELEHRKKHLHAGQVTIDCDVARNPDIVALFGTVVLAPYFAGKKFKRIEFEGFFPEKFSKQTCEDLLQLLEPEGNILLSSPPFEEDLTSEFQAVVEGKQDGIFLKKGCRKKVPVEGVVEKNTKASLCTIQ